MDSLALPNHKVFQPSVLPSPGYGPNCHCSRWQSLPSRKQEGSKIQRTKYSLWLSLTFKKPSIKVLPVLLHNKELQFNGQSHIHLLAPGDGSLAWCGWVFCSGSHKVEIKMSGRLSLRAQGPILGPIRLSAQFSFLHLWG